MPWLRWLVAGLSLYMPGFSPMLVHVGFVVNRVTQGQVIFLPVSIMLVFIYLFSLLYNRSI